MAEAPALRIHVLVERDGEVPLWAQQAIETLAAFAQADVRLRRIDAVAPPPAFGPWVRWWRATIPALHPAQASVALERHVATATPGDGDPDVVLALDARTAAALERLESAASTRPQHWLVGDAAGRACDAALPFLEAVTSGRGLDLHVWRCAAPERTSALIRKAHVPTPSRYGCALDSLGMQLGHLLRQCVTDTLLGVAPRTSTAQATTPPAPERPNEGRVLLKAWRGSWNEWRKQMQAKWLSEYWRIGIMDAPTGSLLTPGPRPAVRWITDADGSGYWADPIAHPTNPRLMFCEYFDEHTGLGHLERLELDAQGQVQRRTPLRVGTGGHASFPLVTRIDGMTVGVAETAAQRECVLHEVDDQGRWRPIATMLQGVRAADPAVFQWEGRYWLAFTDMDLGETDNLCLYHADHLTGPWTPHANNPVKVDVTSARMAGPLFRDGEQLLRPAQNCLATYGASVVLHRIVRCTPTEFLEEPVTRLLPQEDGVCPDGLHTVSAWDQRTLIDGKRHRFSTAAVRRKLRRRWTQGSRIPRTVRAPLILGAERVAVYIPHLRMGGGEMSLLRLAGGFAAMGLQVDLVVHTMASAELTLPPGLHVIELGTESSTRSVTRLASVLRERRPRWLLSAFPHTNIASVAAVRLARIDCRCVISEHAPLSRQIEREPGWRFKALPPLVRWAYRRADAVVAVSEGVREDLIDMIGADPTRLHVIHNPVLHDANDTAAAATPPHAWLLDPGLKVVMSASRLSIEKDIPTLIRAFARLHRDRPGLRLVVAGEGPDRPRLEALVAELGLREVIALPGRVAQPQGWMRHAAAFALASQYEGFGNALVEAMASGVPVVSTDCPVGPREILADGRYGELVPVGDDTAMAEALARALDRREPPADARAFAERFTVAESCAKYRRLFDTLGVAR